MQALAGVLYPDVFTTNHMLKPMLDIMAHRGNEIKTHSFKNLETATRGAKYQKNKKGNVVMAIDGNIYHVDRLIKKLASLGHNGSFASNEEVLLLGYDHLGIRMIEEIGGQFALLIIDHQKQKFFLARDRIGKKPLYWCKTPRYFLFASEMKAIVATGAVPQNPSLEALAFYLYFGYIPQDMSPIETINKLLPAHYLEANFNGTYFIQSYWSYSSYFKQEKQSNGHITEKLNEILRESTEKNLKSHGSVGAFLTGGIGSSSVAWYLNQMAQKGAVQGFSAGFLKESRDDFKAADAVAKKLDIPLHFQTVDEENFIDDFVPIAWHLDEPNADPNVLATWAMSKLAATSTNTVFSGMGSDELFAIHSRYSTEETHMNRWKRAALIPIPWMQKFIIEGAKHLWPSLAFKTLKQMRQNPWQYEYMQQNALMPKHEIATASPKLAEIFDPEVFLHKFHHIDRLPSSVSSFLYFDIKTRLADNYILQYDRITSAFSLDWKTPYLDRNLIEYVATLPEPEYLQEKESGYYLKELLRGKIPDEVLLRPKKTRRDFLKEWIVKDPVLSCLKLLPSGSLVEAGLISREWIFKCLDEMDSNPESYRYLWATLSLEVWFRLYITNPMTTKAPTMSVFELLSIR